MEDMHNRDCIDQPNVWDWDTWNQKHWWLVQPMNTMTFYGFYTISFFNPKNQFNQNKHFVVRKLFLFKNTLKYNFVCEWAILSSFGHFNRYIICSLKNTIFANSSEFRAFWWVRKNDAFWVNIWYVNYKTIHWTVKIVSIHARWRPNSKWKVLDFLILYFSASVFDKHSLKKP